jgi:hypothetical protein
MSDADIARACADAALVAGREIRELVHAMPPVERARPTRSLLKPAGGYGARHVDAEAEALGLAHLERLAGRLGVAITLLGDGRGGGHRIGPDTEATIWASMDVIDGTVKVAGLGEVLRDRVRLANDGGWAAAFAFTLPTRRSYDELVLGDFAVAAVVDGNPPRFRAYPQDVIALPGADGPATWDASGPRERRVFTTSSEDLGQLWVSLDVFQAYDRATRRPGDEGIGVELYRLLVDRHAGGAFDVLRQYANLSALTRVLFGWREAPVWVESQGAAFIAVNENLPNLLPAVPLVAGAGGTSVDFDGRPLGARRLADGRTSIIHAANAPLCRRLLDVVAVARERTAKRGRPARS